MADYKALLESLSKTQTKSNRKVIVNKKLTEAVESNINIDKIAKFIKDAVDGLQKGPFTNYRYKLDDRLAIFVGWSQGFDENDNTCIHDKKSPEYCIVAGIKVWTSDDMWTDYEWLNFPYYENGEVRDESDTAISPNENYQQLARSLVDDYKELSKLDIDEDGLILEESKQSNKKLLKESASKLDKLLNKVTKQIYYLYDMDNPYDTWTEFKRAMKEQFMQLQYVDEYIEEWEQYEKDNGQDDNVDEFLDTLKQIKAILENELPPKPPYLGFDESVNMHDEKSLKESKKLLKEETGPYKGNEFLKEVAKQLESLNDYGYINEHRWEVKIWNNDGNLIEEPDIDSNLYKYMLRDISYPVADGHLEYDGIELILYGLENVSKKSLELLCFDKKDIKDYLKDKNTEISTHYTYEIDTGDYDIDSEDDYEDEDIDESVKKNSKKLLKEGFEYLDGSKVKVFSDYNTGKRVADKSGLKESEYGKATQNKKYDIYYTCFNKSGDRNDTEEIICYYGYDDNGKPRKLTKDEKEFIEQTKELTFDTTSSIKSIKEDANEKIYKSGDKVSFSNLPDKVYKKDFDELKEKLENLADKSKSIYRVDTYGSKFKIEVLKANGAVRGTYGPVGGKFKRIKTIYGIADDSIKESIDFSRSNIIEFPSGDYVYVEEENGKLYAGSATNTGMFHEYEVDIEGDESTDNDLQNLYDLIISEHPEYLDDINESVKFKRKK